MPNGTKSPMIASAAADASSSIGHAHPERRVARSLGPGELPVRRARRRASISSRSMIVPWCRFISGRGGQSSGGGTSGRVAHWPVERVGPVAERADDRQDLAVVDVRHHAGLADLVAAHRLDHLEREHRRRARVREVLRGRPDAGPAGRLFHHLDRGAEAAPAEQRAGAGDQARHDRHLPEVLARAPFEAEEGPGIHRRRRLYRRRVTPHSSSSESRKWRRTTLFRL